MANRNVKMAVCLAAAALVLAIAAHYAADYLYFHQHMAGLVMADDPVCDLACADRIMTEGYFWRYELGHACVEVGPNSYVCRPARGADDLRKEGYQIMTVPQPNAAYGEIFVVPTDGTDVGIYHVGEVLLTDVSSDKIRVNFYEYFVNGSEIIHVADMVPGDTYVDCNPYIRNVLHIVEYTGTFDMNGTGMAEFWAVHILPRPQELSPCDAEKVIRKSLQVDYDIDLPDYGEFERMFQARQGR